MNLPLSILSTLVLQTLDGLLANLPGVFVILIPGSNVINKRDDSSSHQLSNIVPLVYPREARIEVFRSGTVQDNLVPT